MNNDVQLPVNVTTFNGIITFNCIEVERCDWASRDMLTMLVEFIINDLFNSHEVNNEPLYAYTL
ncbi:hypothetical protein JCM16161A_12720 [Vulcanisaeta sp. JCM 16161]